MPVFITNQTKLALVVGVTPQHLSTVKNSNKPINSDLSEKLTKVTGIEYTLWSDPEKKLVLKEKLKTFFLNQREKEKATILDKQGS